MNAQNAIIPDVSQGKAASAAEFNRIAREMGLDPANQWVGGYVDYEWEHLRHVLTAYGLKPEGRQALEFGCNYGASSIVMARLGAQVTGVDVDEGNVRLANANIAQHDLADRVQALHVADTRSMPFADGQFDLAIANSVLEYVDPAQLDAVMAELHRVMQPGGELLVLGTASRLSPCEVHSRRWLVNYMPRAMDRLFGTSFQRGLSPLLLAKTLRGRFEVVSRESWIAARIALHGQASLPVRTINSVAEAIDIAPGWLSPNIELLLRRI
ncbi:MAG: class I SAM-dependent methyltransferase [Sphingomonadaceae bacterium]|nr:class I SAM-dependent methyltransferase [Sphingomonadaceae bacterium]